MRSPLALIVNELPVGKQRAIVLVERRHFVKGQIMDKDSGGVGHVVRTAAKIDRLSIPARPPVIRLRRSDLDSIERDRHPRRKLRQQCKRQRCVQTSVAISSAVRPPIVQYTPPSAVGIAPSTIDDVLPRVFFDHALQRGFGLLAGTGHDRFVIFPGKQAPEPTRPPADGSNAASTRYFRRNPETPARPERVACFVPKRSPPGRRIAAATQGSPPSSRKN